MDRLAPPSVPEQRVNIPLQIPPHVTFVDNPNTIDLNSLFKINELKGVLSLVKDTAPDEDGMPYSFLSYMDDTALHYYLSLINTVMVSGHIPQSWRTQTLILLLKSNKISSDPTSYRPIALSSVLAKITEHLVKHRPEWFLEHNNNILSNNQFGFRKGKCTIDSLGICTTDIRLALSGNDSIVAAFLDITAA